MKTMTIKKLMLSLAVLMLTVSAGFAQRGYGQGYGRMNHNPGEPGFINVIPNLSDTQKEKILDLHTKMLDKTTALRADLQVQQAELKALMVKDTDTKQKEAVLKKISDLRYQISVEHMNFHDNVRALLDDDQKVAFDNWTLNHKGPRGHRGQKGYRGGGRGYGYGNGPYWQQQNNK